MPQSQQVGTEEPKTNVSVPQQEGQADAISGKAQQIKIQMQTMNQRDQTLTLKQSMKKKKTLMQNMQKLSYLELGHCIRGQ